MQIILLSGGSGKRLWPLSNDMRSKQFLRIFHRPDELGGGVESMMQRVYRGFAGLGMPVTVATSRAQVSTIKRQIGEKVSLSVEPCRRDTFPAIALASAYLHDRMGLGEDEPVAVCPVDPFVDDAFFSAVVELGEKAKSGAADLFLLGINPTYPSEKYGYIIPVNDDDVSPVKGFKEKPSEETAKKYMEQGALWNGGVFAYRLGYMLKKSEELLGTSSHDELAASYDKLTKISMDYAVVEKEKSVAVQRFYGTWKDLGTWNTFTEAMSEVVFGNGLLDESSSNSNIVNELDVPVIGLGVKDIVIAASPEGVLVTEKQRSGKLKGFVENLHQQVMVADKSWGRFWVLNANECSLTVKITLMPGRSMSYQRHNQRHETWIILSGKGYAVIDGKRREVKAGDSMDIPTGVKHMLAAETRMEVIEVQVGEISRNDKEIFDGEI